MEPELILQLSSLTNCKRFVGGYYSVQGDRLWWNDHLDSVLPRVGRGHGPLRRKCTFCWSVQLIRWCSPTADEISASLYEDSLHLACGGRLYCYMNNEFNWKPSPRRRLWWPMAGSPTSINTRDCSDMTYLQSSTLDRILRVSRPDHHIHVSEVAETSSSQSFDMASVMAAIARCRPLKRPITVRSLLPLTISAPTLTMFLGYLGELISPMSAPDMSHPSLTTPTTLLPSTLVMGLLRSLLSAPTPTTRATS